MNRFRTTLLALCIAIAVAAGPGTVRAQHVDVMVLQVNGHLVTGKGEFESGKWTLGQRVYSRKFDSDFLVNNPGFNSLGAGSALLPPGSQSLPPVANLSWDFLPMEIGEATSNLFYWDGSDSNGQDGLTSDDVAFGALPGPNYGLTMFDKNSQPYAIHGFDQSLAPGGLIARTDASGFVHQHNYFLLDDGSGYQGTSPADGIYLWALQVRMPGMQTSRPFYMVFGTPGSSIAALNQAAVPWIEQQLDLPGDYTGDGRVDVADYTAWRDTLGQTGTGLAADGSGNQIVDADDFEVWKEHFADSAILRIAATAGNGASGTAAEGVPEPQASSILVIVAVASLLNRVQVCVNRTSSCGRRARLGLESARRQC